MTGGVEHESGDHVCVCIPTYRRPSRLGRLLSVVADFHTTGEFSYSVLVVDNDESASAEPTVTAFASRARIPVRYVRAREKNVAIARNTAVEHARGSHIAFIDDDELPCPEWLVNLYTCLRAYNVDGVLGPVHPVFDRQPPNWILRTRVFERPIYPTGTVLDWGQTRTGNVLLRRAIFSDDGYRFNEQFKHSEDKDFFRRVIKDGYHFVWCAEAPVYETETNDRFTPRYHLKRALVRGNAAMRHHEFSLRRIATSVVAVPLYCAVLPFVAVGGPAPIMKYLIKACDHAGGLLALAGIDLVDYFGGA
jgi:glycosyltransferase involved in cell wall biosynthesis